MGQSKNPDPHDPPEGATQVKIDGKVEGVVAGSISLSGGKNQIIGQLHKTVHIAVNLADHMVGYAARIKGADVRMRDIADRIRATSSILHGIEILFEQLSSEPKEGFSKVPDAANDLYAEIQSCETWLGGVGKQMSDFMEGVPAPKRVEGKVREKVELAQESLVLLETKIATVELGIQDHKVNLQIRLSIFSLSFSNQKPDLTWSDVISDMLSELRRILSELDLLRNGTEPKTLHSPALGASNASKIGLVPAPAAFNPRYAGWLIQNGSPHAKKSDAKIRSWLKPGVTPLAFSSEQLYLQVVGLMVEDGKKNQTLHSTYERLGPQRQSAILDLLAQENQELQKEQPVLEWKLASIRPQMHRIDRYQREIVSMLVILKTELKPHVDWESLKGPQVPHLRGGTLQGLGMFVRHDATGGIMNTIEKCRKKCHAFTMHMLAPATGEKGHKKCHAFTMHMRAPATDGIMNTIDKCRKKPHASTIHMQGPATTPDINIIRELKLLPKDFNSSNLSLALGSLTVLVLLYTALLEDSNMPPPVLWHMALLGDINMPPPEHMQALPSRRPGMGIQVCPLIMPATHIQALLKGQLQRIRPTIPM
ncbi:uncharacterized protein N0V89_004705 [Didymosphaeria variabile]|uniref:Uncharacterized protein n=1 Tax=Didymosphaeria variabile TaxID=1932322 RepID=A0A9W8XQR9_9PLEO|nr:uncharacterized protein N0V89_004705 [Didymosphaeria variabile]KAJ4356669.1 hypothetical protein N0V89_004705 [Didymosphaeria variabile]